MPLLKETKDLFSEQSKEYSESRPTYPSELFEFIVGLVQEKNVAWDCATGNGQAAVALSAYFRQVIASDVSSKQIENAQRKPNIRYEIFPAEKTPIEAGSIDLVTVAQALHWFDFERFYSEVNRILKKKSGILAAWAYGLHSVSPEIDAISRQLYNDVLENYWPVERKYIEARYETIPFPFERVSVPEFQIALDWNAVSLINYIYTWSSVQKFIQKNRSDPVKQFAQLIREAWGDEKRLVVWPLYVKVGRSEC